MIENGSQLTMRMCENENFKQVVGAIVMTHWCEMKFKFSCFLNRASVNLVHMDFLSWCKKSDESNI